MFDWLPEVCQELRGNLVQIYWLLLIPWVVFLICLEFFKIPEAGVGAGRIIKRAVISVILLYSFEECMNLIAMIADGITEKINGIMQLKEMLHKMKENYQHMEGGWLKLREALIFIISLLSYIVAYLGVFVADVLIHFVWSILYVVSPLMILMYVSEKTAGITGSLYRGLMNVMVWKVLWSILGVLLLKMASTPEMANSENFLNVVLMNLCIGLSMLFIPMTTKSLISNGMDGAASSLAAAPAIAAAGAVKLYTMKYGKAAAKEPFTGFKGTRQFLSRNYGRVKTGVQKSREFATKSNKQLHKIRNHNVTEIRHGKE